MKTGVDVGQLVAALADAVVVADPDGIIVLWNAAATRLFGFAEDEALGRTLNLITPERLRERHNVGFAHSMATGTTRYGEQLLKVPAKHKDGRTLSIAFTVAMLFDDQHRVTGVAAVIRDETARFKAERELSQRLAALEQRARPAASAQ
jgi:PAS domain S-box-containing protein